MFCLLACLAAYSCCHAKAALQLFDKCAQILCRARRALWEERSLLPALIYQGLKRLEIHRRRKERGEVKQFADIFIICIASPYRQSWQTHILFGERERPYMTLCMNDDWYFPKESRYNIFASIFFFLFLKRGRSPFWRKKKNSPTTTMVAREAKLWQKR